ncbi:MAG TPA: sigma-70 family RNA polymerase sigma factor [Candidatus Anaerobutyricum avicola]|nr:sigma-70 family RNA polymerase sigma factor [Candidatus Anaerobutyricum avicola]
MAFSIVIYIEEKYQGALMIQYLEALDTEEEKTVFREIYERFSRQLYRTAYYLMNDHAQTEDMVHETFMILTENMDKIEKVDNPKTWSYLSTILRHLCINALKRQQKTIAWEENIQDLHTFSENNSEENILHQEKIRLVRDLIRELKYPYRQVLCLQYYNEMSTKDIAATLNIKQDNVRQIARRAKEQLKKKWMERGYDQ